MIGLYAANWSASGARWGQTASAGQMGRVAVVSRAQPRGTDQPVTPVTAAPASQIRARGSIVRAGAASGGAPSAGASSRVSAGVSGPVNTSTRTGWKAASRSAAGRFITLDAAGGERGTSSRSTTASQRA